MNGWLTVAGAAGHTGCCEEHVRRAARARTLPGVKVGRAWRFAYDDVESWIRRGSPAPTPRRPGGHT